MLLLARHKHLVAGGRAKAQLVNDGSLLLRVDLHSDPCLKRGLLCRGRGAEAWVPGDPGCSTLSPGLWWATPSAPS